jgi:hypothetical protein
MKRFIIFFSGAFFYLCNTSEAQTPTFHEDVASIIYDNCTSCHHTGALGPNNLVTYNDVSSYGGYIVSLVASGEMPPWIPDHEYTELRGERWLSEEDKQVLYDWVDSGMQEGDPTANPGVPEFPTGSVIGTPDIVLSMDAPFFVNDDYEDQYQIFLIPTGITETTYVKAVEVITGNSAIAHHAIIGYVENPAVIAEAQALDDATPEPGYPGFGGFGVSIDEGFAGWTPGSPPTEFLETMGKVMQPGSYLLIQMHYGPSYSVQSDLTSINIFTTDVPIEREVQSTLMSPYNFEPLFIIPANQITTFHATINIPVTLSFLSITPHSHLLGKSWLVYATSPDNQDTIPLISIPEWDFDWQGRFTFSSPLIIPGGYVVHAIGEYDNTTNNPNNPFSPPQWATWGEGTTDEMFVVFLQYVLYQPGDESLTYESYLDENGCTYASAINFSPTATVDDGSCLFEDCDLVSEFLTGYDAGYADGLADGGFNNCPGDLDGDLLITTMDLLVFLTLFGLPCD